MNHNKNCICGYMSQGMQLKFIQKRYSAFQNRTVMMKAPTVILNVRNQKMCEKITSVDTETQDLCWIMFNEAEPPW